MKKPLLKLFLFIITNGTPVVAAPIWSRDFEVTSPRENLYELPPREFETTVLKGRRHALFYPVTVSELRVPYQPIKTFFDSDPDDPVRKFLYDIAKSVSPFKSMNDMYAWLGLNEFPVSTQSQNPNPLPSLSVQEMALPMGATILENEDGKALTFGCVTCHAGDLFGVKVVGLTNRFPRANEFFRYGAELLPYVNTFVFKQMFQATEGERKILVRAKENIKYVGTKRPVVIGLDTSLAQVALSLAKRRPDEYATRSELGRRFPRPNKLETMIADSKPAVWWNVKYKNRWLSDGSIVSGNPVHTNFLWNEIGRGTDLKVLERWLLDNDQTIRELTAAVFASKSPRYEKFFGIDAIDLEKAKRGEAHYVQSCQRCHGAYEKGWDSPVANQMTKEELIQNTTVTYHTRTPVKDVETDPGRYLGMKEFAADLNRLAISRAIGTVVEPQKGYVPPPLDGIWARWPYFHNNSVPNLCALLSQASSRPVTFFMGKAVDKERDFDQDCVGYPLGTKTPKEWTVDQEYLFDTRREGLSNKGHDERIIMKDGVEIFTPQEKAELIEFLKTL